MKVFITCSSSEKISSKYKNITSSISTMLCRLNNKLVFNGNVSGMNNTAYMTFKYEGAKIKAVSHLNDASDVEGIECDSVDLTRTTFERTKLLYESCDIILILPGGLTTLAELFSMIVESIVRKDGKKIVLFNYEDYFRPLMNMLKSMFENRFIDHEDIKRIDIINDINVLENYFINLEKRK